MAVDSSQVDEGDLAYTKRVRQIILRKIEELGITEKQLEELTAKTHDSLCHMDHNKVYMGCIWILDSDLRQPGWLSRHVIESRLDDVIEWVKRAIRIQTEMGSYDMALKALKAVASR